MGRLLTAHQYDDALAFLLPDPAAVEAVAARYAVELRMPPDIPSAPNGA